MDPEYNMTDALTKRGNLEADTHTGRVHSCEDYSDAASAKELPETILPARTDPPLAHQGNRTLPTPQSCTSSLQNFRISVV